MAWNAPGVHRAVLELPWSPQKRQVPPQILPQSLAAPCSAPEDALAPSSSSAWKKGGREESRNPTSCTWPEPQAWPLFGYLSETHQHRMGLEELGETIFPGLAGGCCPALSPPLCIFILVRMVMVRAEHLSRLALNYCSGSVWCHLMPMACPRSTQDSAQGSREVSRATLTWFCLQ